MSTTVIPPEVPEIVLPENHDQEPCSVCGWQGGNHSLLHTNYLTMRDLPRAQRGKCVSCSILATLIEQHVLDTTGEPPEPTERIMTSVLDPIVFITGSELHIFITPTLQGTQAVQAPLGLPLRPLESFSVASQDSLAWAKYQISNCRQWHNECSQFQETDSFLPTRLINVSPQGLEGDVLLEDASSVPRDSPYVALSYKWGGSHPACLTTTATLADRQKRMPWSTLPKTFQDAVEVTRALGMKYLWIDSICIIQGDPDDWNREAGKMFHVYRNAYVTLCAVWGDSPDSGLFPKSVRWWPRLTATLRLREHTWLLYLQREHSVIWNWNWDKERRRGMKMPLFDRAWAYQERLISPRVLLFTESELVFDCFRGAVCQCGVAQLEMSQGAKKSTHSKGEYFSIVQGSRNVKDADHANASSPQQKEIEEDNHVAWRRIVSTYSQQQLSNRGDRLPAIGAVAEQFQALRPGARYLAGLWSDTLLLDLLWYKHPPDMQHAELGSSRPTWSWASSGGRTNFMNLRLESFQLTAEVVQASCTYIQNNPFGTLESCNLVVRGRLLRVRAVQRLSHLGQHTVGLYHWRAGARLGGIFDQAHMDLHRYIDGWQLQKRLYLLEIAKLEKQSPRVLRYCLVLRCEDWEHRIFSRVGFLNMAYSNNFIPSSLLEWLWDRAFRKHGSTVDCTII